MQSILNHHHNVVTIINHTNLCTCSKSFVQKSCSIAGQSRIFHNEFGCFSTFFGIATSIFDTLTSRTVRGFSHQNNRIAHGFQGLLWSGMEGKNCYGIWNGSSMEWKIWSMERNKSSIFHTNSILAHCDMGCQMYLNSVEHISKQNLSSTRTVIRKLSAFFVISVTNSNNVNAKRRSLLLILFSWGQGTLSQDFCMFTSVLPACHCVRRDSYLASIASKIALWSKTWPGILWQNNVHHFEVQ